MAGPQTIGTFKRSDDIVDADYISIAPTDRVGSPTPALAGPTVPVANGIEFLNRANVSGGDHARPAGPLFWTGGAVIAFAAFWMAGGHILIERPEAQASPSVDNSLRIASVISRVDRSGDKPLLLIDGKAVNDGRGAVTMPPLHIQVVSTSGGSTLYKLGTAGRSLEGGDFFDFSSRFDLPKDGVKTVFVTFAQ